MTTVSHDAGAADALEDELRRRGLDGFLVPLADEHQGEYVPPRAQRLAWLTGFTGSAGLAWVLSDDRPSAIFVDGRYTLQVRDQVDAERFEPQHLLDTPPSRWAAEHLKTGDKIGYDPWLHTPAQLDRLRPGVVRAGAELVACDDNPLDAVWADQPPPPAAPIRPHPLRYAGESSADKRARLAQTLREQKTRAAVLTLPDSIAWLLNVRGGDVERSPLPLSFALLYDDGRVDLFVDPVKTDAELTDHLGDEVAVRPPDALAGALDALGGDRARVRIDPDSAAAWLHQRLRDGGAAVVAGDDPCLLPKSQKNAVELDGMRAAHVRDGAALSRFLHWLDVNAGGGAVDELAAEAKLSEFRAAGGELKDLSFDTIAGAGANGAIVHYRVDADSNRPLRPGTLFLVDSGGQYLDGTTDVTRTVAIGAPSDEQRDRFTRVLKGHIALASARFPAGTSGSQLDVLARLALWRCGLDYDHGTGHGVGSYLCVHEGPQRISKVANSVALKAGMVISNEPGYYKTGEYGIRIENLVAVSDAADIAGGERPMHGFETLTLAPIDLNLVDVGLLDGAERDWLNRYHRRVREQIGPLLAGDDEARGWLERATRSV